ncbi:MAG TPA: restriction endonuclease subunit S [Prosthecochloris aestuarii]|uniref:Restriction endonuclease subunit S n=1 Tax=Prosthecochloris aestuarii TaxID=1102 RepID=A0A831WPU8_PROAE|nr:restriction endonuclease subunit S [Prosthecochloris aestuarii]
MSSEWKEYNLEDCLDALIDYRGKTPQKTNNGIPLVTAKIIKSGRIETPTEFIAAEDYNSWMRRGIPKPGDVVLTTEAPLGEVAILGKEKVALAQRVITLRGQVNLLNSRYLYYLFQTEETQNQLRYRATGTTVLGIKQRELRKLPINLPPIEYQNDIVSILAPIDDRIALLRETNATLESIAQAIFKSWFIDFDPVKARQQGLEPQGMDAATAALFPDAFQDSGLGPIPAGWRVGRVENVLELSYGKALKSIDRILGDIPVYGSGGIIGYHNKSLVNESSIIVGRKGTVESLYWEDMPFFPIDTVYYVKGKMPLTYCYYLLETLGLNEMNTDAAVPGLNRNNVYRLPVIIPSKSLIEMYDSVIGKLRAKIRINKEKTQTLASIRDALLPRLISGRLRLPEAEAMVVEAGL